MKKDKKNYYLLGGLLLIVVVGLGVFAGSGGLFQGALVYRPSKPLLLPVATVAPPPAAPIYSNVSQATNKDTTPPTNQNELFPASVSKHGGASVGLITSVSDPTDEIWFAPIDEPKPFSNGVDTSRAAGNDMTILAPSKAGTYALSVRDAAGNYSQQSKAILTVDNNEPTVIIESPASAKDASPVHDKSLIVKVKATDNTGVEKVELYADLDSKHALIATHTKPEVGKKDEYQFTIDLPLNVHNSSLTLSVWAYNAASNIGKTSADIVVDNPSPDLSVSSQGSPIGPQDLWGPNETLRLNTHVNVSGSYDISRTELWLDGTMLYNSSNGGFKVNDFMSCSGPIINADCSLIIISSDGTKDPHDVSGGGVHFVKNYNPILFPLNSVIMNGFGVHHTLTIKAFDDIGSSSEQQIKFYLWYGTTPGDLSGHSEIRIDP